MNRALTDEEWARAFDEGENRDTIKMGDVDFWRWTDGESPEIGMRDRGRSPSQCASVSTATEAHALAALCLHGQDFGFTRYDVEELRVAAKSLVAELDKYGVGPSPRLNDLADRIEALLPPETKDLESKESR